MFVQYLSLICFGVVLAGITTFIYLVCQVNQYKVSFIIYMNMNSFVVQEPNGRKYLYQRIEPSSDGYSYYLTVGTTPPPNSSQVGEEWLGLLRWVGINDIKLGPHNIQRVKDLIWKLNENELYDQDVE